MGEGAEAGKRGGRARGRDGRRDERQPYTILIVRKYTSSVRGKTTAQTEYYQVLTWLFGCSGFTYFLKVDEK